MIDEHQQILKALGAGRIEASRVSLGYRIGLAAVAVLMLALPVIYFLIIAGVGWLTWRHMIDDITIFEHVKGRGAVAAYVMPLVAGCVILLFLVKPLIPRKREKTRELEVNRESQPLLFEYIEKLCALIGAPKPRKIVVDCNVNASASFRKGIFSLLGSDLTLTIGLPLVSGMPLRNFTGVLAHEFGHFAQGAGMRLTYIIRNINFWFVRLVYERDGVDGFVVSLRQSGGWIGLMGLICQGLIWISRRVLWVLMMTGHTVSCFMLRQMEFDADRYEARVAGSEAFEATSRSLVFLNISSQVAFNDLQSRASEKMLSDDLPWMIVTGLRRVTPEIRAKVSKKIEETRTGYLDTHPCDTDRINNALAENAKGLVELDAPATALFMDYPRLCREASEAFYREAIGEAYRQFRLVPAAEYLSDCISDEEGAKAMRRYAQGGQLGSTLYTPRPRTTEPMNPNEAKAALETLRRRLLEEEAPKARELMKEYDQTTGKIKNIRWIREVIQVGLKVTDPAQFQLSGADAPNLNFEEDQCGKTLERFVSGYRAFGDLIDERLGIGLSIARGDPQRDRRMGLAMECIEAFGRAKNHALEVLYRLESLKALGHCLSNNQEVVRIQKRLPGLCEEISRFLEFIAQALGDAQSPLPRDGQTISFIQQVRWAVPPSQSVELFFNECRSMIGRLYNGYFDCVALIVKIAEDAEKSVGFEPLPEIEQEPDEADEQ